MNKKLIMIGIVLLIIGSVSAYTIGQTINQNIFDNQDFTTHDLGMSITNVYKANDRVFVEFSYDTLRQLSDTNDEWTIVQLTGRIPYYIRYYRNCRDTNTVLECKQEMRKFVVNKAKSFRQTERNWLEENQTKIDNEIEITDFTGLELNVD